MNMKGKYGTLFTFSFVLLLIAFSSYFAWRNRVDLVVPGNVALEDLVFNREHFSIVGNAEYPPDPGLAGGISYKDEKGNTHYVRYPDYNLSVRGFLLDFDSTSIKAYIWKMESTQAARDIWERLYLVEGSMLAKEKGRIKKRDYLYARIVRFGGIDETLIWQKDYWVVLVKSTEKVLSEHEEKTILTELFDPRVRS